MNIDIPVIPKSISTFEMGTVLIVRKDNAFDDNTYGVNSFANAKPKFRPPLSTVHPFCLSLNCLYTYITYTYLLLYY